MTAKRCTSSGRRIVGNLPNSGHLAFEDQPGLWIGSVRDFINGERRAPRLAKDN
jgi:hypothetical protein